MKRQRSITPSCASRRSKRIASMSSLMSENSDQQRSFEAFRVLASGSSHQGDRRRYKGNNSQCTAMSSVACLHSCIIGRVNFTSSIIDFILNCGDCLYLRLRPLGSNARDLHPHLRPEEMRDLDDVQVGNHLAEISIEWKKTALYPNFSYGSAAGNENIETILSDLFTDADHSDAIDSYLFTGLGFTTSFWRHNGQFFYFNSHGVDESNVYNHDAGRARLFQCTNIKALAQLLFTLMPETPVNLNPEDIQQQTHGSYEINKIRLVSSAVNLTRREPIVMIERLSAPNLREVSNDDHTLDPKLTTLEPTVVLNALPISEWSAKDVAQFSSDIKLSYLKPTVVLEPLVDNPTMDDKIVEKNPRGRPKKVKRGRATTVDNAGLKAVQKYAKNNPHVHREAEKRYYQQNRVDIIAAVTRNSQANPEINRAAVNRYSQQNPEVHATARSRYEESSRNVPRNLRGVEKLIGTYSDDELNTVQLYSLKKTSLYGADIYRCPHCNAPLFEEEKGNKPEQRQWCCGLGKNKITQFHPLTEDFYNNPDFIKHSRAYNHLFAFSALGTTHGFQNPNSGIAFVKVQGRIYHRVFDLGYNETTNPIGLYIEDPSERERIATGRGLNRDIVRSILNLMYEVNPYIECFKRLSNETSDLAHLVFDSTASRPRDGNILGDLPIGNEVAAIINHSNERFYPKRIAIWAVGARTAHQVDILEVDYYETFQYPLLYPHGELGWKRGKKDKFNMQELTQCKYVRCLLLSEPRFTELSRLSEEWIIDMFCRISEQRLRFIHNQQTSRNNNAGGRRVAPLNEVVEALNDETIYGEGGIVPGRIYLPCSFTGGERYMKQKYLDAIALLNRFGSASFFLTMTCNPKWPEIQQSTPPGQNPSPTVCARVFHLKLAELLRDIRSGKYFGKMVYILHVIEFQKRGLPHAHIAFRVEGGGPVHPVDIDTFIRADIPSPTEAEGKLRKAVLNHMIHGPCGENHRTDLQCWDSESKKCTRYFPKKDSPVTYCDDKGFTQLRRDSKNEATIKFRNRDVVVNDLWVVPYNPALLLKYDCHINLEACSARAMIKYLYKYMTKGLDATRVALIPDEDRNNEIELYVSKRYIGSCDAAWRVFEYNTVGHSPTVKHLAIHLPNQQAVYFNPGNVADAVEGAGSTLLTYFARPVDSDQPSASDDPKFDSLTYQEFYELYIVHASYPKVNTRIWQLSNGKYITRRIRGEQIARMFWVAPNRGEQFYLRVLLAAYPCRSFDDLIRLGGAGCTTFQEAARAVGLADDDLEYRRSMQEAQTFMTAPRLRHFFVMLAVNGIPVASLWDQFKDQLSEDFLRRYPSESRIKAYEECLVLIGRLLRKHGSRLSDIGLEEPNDSTTELLREYTDYDRTELVQFVEVWLPKLSVDQRAVYEYVHELVVNKEHRENSENAIFIDGPAGTGKTLLLNLITSHVRGDLAGVVLCTASSGIAAQNYPNGMTAHSMFKLPIELVDDLGHWGVTRRSQRGELISKADVIIYDEAPMAHKYLIHMLDRSLRDLMNSEKIFGGKVIIFAGDFRQIPPVVPNARADSDVVNSSVKSSVLWDQLKTFTLTTSQRQTNDPEFAEFLLKLGSNQLPTERVTVGRSVQNLIDLSMISHVTLLKDLIDFVFPTDDLNDPDLCAGRAILCTHNVGVKEINNEIMHNRLENNELMHFFGVDKVVNEGPDELFYGPEVLNQLQPNGVPEYDLVLRVGALCMITRNLSFADGLVNGTKVIVVSVTSPRLIRVRKPNQHQDYLIPRIQFKAPIDRRSPIEMMRTQFPLQVCYAMSIHKSQGQTISRVGVDLRSDVFSHGQLYVALGRAQNRDAIKILTSVHRVANDRFMANNIVYPQLL